MVFSSIAFLFFFLPIVLGVHMLLPSRLRNGFLLAASVFFYTFGDVRYLPLILILTLINYAGGRLTGTYGKTGRKLFMYMTIAIDVLALGYYKYAKMLPFVTEYPALPLGISFYIFQSISYIADVGRGEVRAERSLVGYAVYIMLFPQLIAGPIVRYSDIARELHERRLLPERLESGMTTFLLGLAAKVILANRCGALFDALMAVEARGMLPSAAALIACGFQYYFDFQGYSLMAIGIGRMLGFTFPENFNHPFASRSIREFWRRWHMTLGSWLRSYVYIPLGGSKNGRLRTAVNVLVTWAISGLWHGAGLNFLAWGLYFGALIVLENLLIGNWLERHRRAAHGYTFTAVALSWIFFSQESADGMIAFVRELFNPSLGQNALFVLACGAPVLMAAALFSSPKVCGFFKEKLLDRNVLRVLLMLVLFALSVMELLRLQYNPFLYFRF